MLTQYPKVLSKLILVISIFLLNSCYFYQRIPVTPSNTWKTTFLENDLQPYTRVILQKFGGYSHYELVNYKFEDSLLTGTLVSSNYFQIPSSPSFARSRIPRADRGKISHGLFVASSSMLVEGPFSLDLNELSSMNRYGPNVGANVGATIGLIMAPIIAAGIFVLIACSCPRVYAINADGDKVFYGSLFTGAISKSFERTDLLPLKGIDPINNEIVLNIVNELPEEEYINEVKLKKVKHTSDYHLGVATDGSLFEYKHITQPEEAVASNGTSILDNILKQDDLLFDFPNEENSTELNSAIFTFDKSKLRTTKDAKLIVYGRQTEWLEQTAEALFSLYGTDFDKLNHKMDKYPKKLYEQYNAKRGISMNAYMMTDNGWKSLGTFHNAGIVKQKLMGMNLDLSEISGDEVQIKLEAAFKFWELDQVVISDDWHPLTNMEDVPMKWAVNESGQDVSSLIRHIDKEYAIQPAETSHIQISFEHTANHNEVYILQGTGYYRHVRDYTHEPNMAIVKKLKKRGKMGAHQLSREVYWYMQRLNANNMNN